MGSENRSIANAFISDPETARKSLEEIDILFDSRIPPWKSAKANVNALEERAAQIEQKNVAMDEKRETV